MADRYRIVRALGRGGMATVYLADDENLGRQVAIKRLHADSPEDTERRFAREAKFGASLNHPNLVWVYDTVADDEGVLIVMEYVDGSTLGHAIMDGPLRPRRAVEVIAAVSSALEHAHEAGIVHRDVKPANVLLGERGVVKLADLGIATAADQHAHHPQRPGAGHGLLHGARAARGPPGHAGQRHLRAGHGGLRGPDRAQGPRGPFTDGGGARDLGQAGAGPARGLAARPRRGGGGPPARDGPRPGSTARIGLRPRLGPGAGAR